MKEYKRNYSKKDTFPVFQVRMELSSTNGARVDTVDWICIFEDF